MARIRTIKPEFFSSEDIVTMTPLSRLFYVALWCESDREGRLDWKPNTFKIRYFAGDNCDLMAMAKELIDRELIVLYEVEGKKYAEIPTFKEHQVVNNRETQSIIPARVKVACTHGSREGRKGKEGKGKEPASTRFLEFWDAWPSNDRKQDKSKCSEKWTLKKLDEVADIILADIESKKTTEKWQKGFIEAPEVYLNNDRWEDGSNSCQTPSGIIPGAI
jgi:hypothetical protein